MADDQSPFFELIGKMFDHIARIEPRVNEVELKVKVIWWIVVTIGSGVGLVFVGYVIEFLKKQYIGG